MYFFKLLLRLIVYHRQENVEYHVYDNSVLYFFKGLFDRSRAWVHLDFFFFQKSTTGISGMIWPGSYEVHGPSVTVLSTQATQAEKLREHCLWIQRVLASLTYISTFLDM